MKTLHRHLLTAGLLAAVGFGAIAQTQTPPAGPAGASQSVREHGAKDPARAEQARARAQERMAKRLGELKQKLAITGGQEGAWNTWTAALKPTPHQRPDRAEFARLTTPERIDRIRAERAHRNAEIDKRMDATKTFYATLGAEQKKVFDTEAMRLLRGGKGGHGGQQGEHHGGQHRG
jgi:protein CpxP